MKSYISDVRKSNFGDVEGAFNIKSTFVIHRRYVVNLVLI